MTGIDVTTDDYGTRRVRAVHTDRGTIKTSCVVNCAGVWAPRLGEMGGVNTPLCAMKHAYIVTERIDGVQNMPNMRDHDASIYFKLQGDTLQIGTCMMRVEPSLALPWHLTRVYSSIVYA